MRSGSGCETCEASWTNSSCVDGATFCIREGKGRAGDCRTGGEGEEMSMEGVKGAVGGAMEVDRMDDLR